MARDKKTIRRAQAIQPYGPGAILDWGQECFVVMAAKGSGWKRKISLERLENYLGVLDGFRLPPLVSRGRRDIGIDTQRFPSWLFCPSCRRMTQWNRDKEVDAKGNLPKCGNGSCNEVILVPMRYIAACENGHLADIDWWRWAHSTKSADSGQCDRANKQLRFEIASEKGASLEGLRIKCGKCNSYRSLGDIGRPDALKKAGQRCYGRHPWQSRDREVSCDESLRALLRSQTAVHFSDVASALDLRVEIDEAEDAFDRLMGETLAPPNPYSFMDRNDVLGQITPLAQSVSYQLDHTVSDEEVETWLNRYFDEIEGEKEEPKSGKNSDLLEDEWPALTRISSSRSQKVPLVISDGQWPATELKGLQLPKIIEEVFLVERLREVRALVGFRRIRPDAVLVHPDMTTDVMPSWLPATEVYGEGIFLKFSQSALTEWEEDQAQNLVFRLKSIKEELQDEESIAHRFVGHLETLPRFIALHTFSHLLVRQLCYESGYHSASIRERLYVFDDKAGILLYTADGDSEGSLGGLVRQGRGDRLAGSITSALERALWCSNDPICQELPNHGLAGLNRAACHACALAAETSCSHLNSLLDRELVIGSGENGVLGLFKGAIDELL
jgi:hypothetical protein